MEKKFITAVGTTATSAAFQLSTVIWPDWIKHHTPLVWVLWILSGIVWVWWLIAHFGGLKHRSEVVAAGVPSPSVNAPINVQVNPVFNNNIQGSPAPEFLRSPLPPTESSSLPNLRCYVEWIYALYEDSPGAWRRAEHDWIGAEKIYIAVFENPSAPRTLAGVPLRDIEANLKFHCSGRRINTAYWLDSNANRMDIPPGHERAVVLGYFSSDGEFVSNENAHIFTAQGDWKCVRTIGEERRVESTDGSIRIEVTLVESRKPNRTIENVTIEIDTATKEIQVIS